MTTKQITPETAFEPENRRLYLGGTDISAIAGFNSYRSCYQCFLEKRGEVTKEDDSDNPLFYWGHALEPAIITRWLRDNPEWELLNRNKFTVDTEYEFLCSNTDAEVVNTVTGEIAILEAKTVASSGFKHWKLGVPYTYYTQGQHYLGVNGYDRVIFAILVMDSRDFVTFEVVRDDAFIEEIRNLAVDFWNTNIIGGVIPDRTAGDWNEFKATDKAVVATVEDIETFNKLKDVKAQINSLETQETELGDALKVKIEDAELLKTEEGKILATWKGSDRITVDAKLLQSEYPDAYAATIKTSYVRRFLTK